MFIRIKRFNRLNRLIRYGLLGCILLGIMPACTTIDRQGINTFESAKTWVLLPFQNNSGTPRAGDKVEEILATLLRSKGINDLHIYQYPDKNAELWPNFDDKHQQEDALKSAQKGNQYAYGITGNIEEWNYKAGVGGEPAVGLSLRIIEIPSGRVVWSATGAKSGWSAETVSGTAQKLLKDLLSDMEIKKI